MLVKWFIMALLLIGANAVHADEAWVEVSPSDSGVPLENPGMGWVFHHYDNSISGYGAPLGNSYNGSEFPGLTVCYLRLSWGYIEPAEGQFNWSILDTPIQRYVAAGKNFAFRFTTLESHNPIRATPEWIEKVGATGEFVTVQGRESREPDYDDPIYLAKLESFLNAVGKRYGSDPHLAFVDVGTLGVWGEGHPIARRYDINTLRRHIDIHQKAFSNSLIVGMDDWNKWFNETGKPTAMEMARSMGLGFRDDSLCIYKDPKRAYSAHLAQPFAVDTPVILEMGHYGLVKRKNTWNGGKGYLQAVGDYRASYVSVHANPIQFLKENNDIVDQINMTLGYRLNLEKAAWPATVKLSEGLTITSQWRNVGVAPCLPGGHVAWSLLDNNDALVAVLVDTGRNMREATPDPGKLETPMTLKQNFALPPNIKPGTYTLAVSVGGPSGTPTIALPLKGRVGKDRRYAIGKLVLE